MQERDRIPTVPAVIVAPEPPSNRQALGYFWRVTLLVRPFWSSLAKLIALNLLMALIALSGPWFGKLYFDSIYPGRDTGLLYAVVAASFAIGLTTSILGAIRSYFSTRVSGALGRAVSLMFFNHLQHLPVRFFDDHRVGEILSRGQDVRASLAAVSRVFETVMVSGAYLLIVPPLLLILNPTLALLALASIPITTAVSLLSARILRRFSQRGMEASADLSAFQFETMSQIRTHKALGSEHHVFMTASNHSRRAFELELKSGALSGGIGVINALVSALGQAVFTLFAWTQLLRDQMSLGDFVAFSGYLGFLIGPVNRFAGMFTSFQYSAVSLGRMFEYLDMPTESDPATAFVAPVSTTVPENGEIVMQNVTFSYISAQPVLRSMSCRITAGQVTAIAGASGAGKSTILRLLARMENPDSGSILLDGMKLADLQLTDARRRVVYVGQEAALMKGTLTENLTLGREGIDRGRLEEVLDVCQLLSFVDALPYRLDSQVAEWGSTLSGGQRQRLALARSLVRPCQVLLLDEPTANLDGLTERVLLERVLAFASNSTIVMVTHRSAAAALAHQVLFMKDGRLVSTGTHEHLMATDAEYGRSFGIVRGAPVDRRLRMLDAGA